MAIHFFSIVFENTCFYFWQPEARWNLSFYYLRLFQTQKWSLVCLINHESAIIYDAHCRFFKKYLIISLDVATPFGICRFSTCIKFQDRNFKMSFVLWESYSLKDFYWSCLVKEFFTLDCNKTCSHYYQLGAILLLRKKIMAGWVHPMLISALLRYIYWQFFPKNLLIMCMGVF